MHKTFPWLSKKAARLQFQNFGPENDPPQTNTSYIVFTKPLIKTLNRSYATTFADESAFQHINLFEIDILKIPECHQVEEV